MVTKDLMHRRWGRLFFIRIILGLDVLLHKYSQVRHAIQNKLAYLNGTNSIQYYATIRDRETLLAKSGSLLRSTMTVDKLGYITPSWPSSGYF